MKYIFFVLLSVIISANSIAQTMVSGNIRPGSIGSNPKTSTVFNGKLYFIANDGVSGNGMYVYDGVNPPSQAFNGFWMDTASRTYDVKMGVLNNKLYFCADDNKFGSGKYGAELFSLNGPGSTPDLVSDIATGANKHGAPMEFFNCNNKLYFVATSNSGGNELFSYDGNKVECLDNTPGLESSYPMFVAVANNKLYYSGFDWDEGEEPYEYDPATGITKQLRDIHEGSFSSNPTSFTGFGGKVYFTASDEWYGRQLFVYDGKNTRRLTNMGPGTYNGVYDIFIYKNQLMLNACSDKSTWQLNTYDPATNIASNADPVNGGSALAPQRYIEYDGKLYFTAVNKSLGRELFVYDGSSIAMVMDINPGAGSSYPSDLNVLNGKLVFTADDGVNGRELYQLGGTTTGIEKAGFQGSAVLYPNPTSGSSKMSIKLPQAVDVVVKISDMTGKTVYCSNTFQASASSTIEIPSANFAPGSYFYQLCDAKGKMLTSGKMVKQ